MAAETERNATIREPAKKEVGGKTYVAEEPQTEPAEPGRAKPAADPSRPKPPSTIPDET